MVRAVVMIVVLAATAVLSQAHHEVHARHEIGDGPLRGDRLAVLELQPVRAAIAKGASPSPPAPPIDAETLAPLPPGRLLPHVVEVVLTRPAALSSAAFADRDQRRHIARAHLRRAARPPWARA